VVNKAGVLIAIEGIDGAGKTTQARGLTRWLNRRGLRAAYTSEPTNGSIGRLVKKHLSRSSKYSEETVALLFAADRLEHLTKFIEPKLRSGITLVADRYLHSSIAYQTAATGRTEWVRMINSQARKPDVSILIDVSVDVALKRLSRKKFIYEKASFLEKVRSEYLRLVEDGEMVKVDGEGSKEEVSQRIIEYVETWLEEHGVW